MQRPSIFSFDTLGDFLSAYMMFRRGLDPSFSFKGFAREVGNFSPQSLHMISQGERVPSAKAWRRLARAIGLSAAEIDFAFLLIESEHALDPSSRRELKNRIKTLRSIAEAKTILSDEFRTIAEWYHSALLEMMDLADFQSDPEWIASRLRHKVDAVQIRSALRRLESLGLCRVASDGRYERTSEVMRTQDINPDAAVRTAQKSMMQLAEEAMETLPVTERANLGLMLTFDREKMAEVRAAMGAFVAKVISLAQSSAKTDTYHLAAHFFPLTCPSAAAAPSATAGTSQ